MRGRRIVTLVHRQTIQLFYKRIRAPGRSAARGRSTHVRTGGRARAAMQQCEKDDDGGMWRMDDFIWDPEKMVRAAGASSQAPVVD